MAEPSPSIAAAEAGPGTRAAAYEAHGAQSSAATSAPPATPIADTPGALQRAPSITSRHEYLLAELRCATLRARLWQADIEAVGLALKATLITPAQALELLHDCDVLRLVGPTHEEARP
jgi:hypothetical protein